MGWPRGGVEGIWQGTEDSSPDGDTAEDWLTRASHGGFLPATFMLSQLYDEGRLEDLIRDI